MARTGDLKTVVWDAPDITALADFYVNVAGLTQLDGDDEWITLTGPDGWRFAVQYAPDHVPPRWPDPAYPQQFHLDVTVQDVDEAERAALGIGATKLDGAGPNWRVYADPVGKPFCLVWEA